MYVCMYVQYIYMYIYFNEYVCPYVCMYVINANGSLDFLHTFEYMYCMRGYYIAEYCM